MLKKNKYQSRLTTLAVPPRAAFRTFILPSASHCQPLLPLHSALRPQLPQTKDLFFLFFLPPQLLDFARNIYPVDPVYLFISRNPLVQMRHLLSEVFQWHEKIWLDRNQKVHSVTLLLIALFVPSHDLPSKSTAKPSGPPQNRIL